MNKFAQVNENGEVVVLYFTETHPEDMPAVDAFSGLPIIFVPDSVAPDKGPDELVYIDGEFREVEKRPEYFYKFNPKEMKWFDPRTQEEILATQLTVIRSKRDRLLAQTDWVAARAYELGEPVPENYKVYRQALRDVTNQPDPFNITWPVFEE